jgi:hypothetical protein
MLLLTDPGEAGRWRLSVREGMQWGLTSGYSVSAFLWADGGSEGGGGGFYVLSRGARGSGGSR